ncbi:uncharacterized protein E0L32_010617 [Thyridium curvatum]|uniref:4-coumarate--CoA ligase n=1 Tax=Thyridium curvatum TaxID=1093900 RepID=A0A507AS56_9PEZI|nr:uncharacterized protein E0L32_010617 [Thyridium curvatum]TPX07721.1 hypothetical protein E0L32_010617 [Thyridium curvatum]
MPSIVDRGPDGIVYRAGRNLPLIDLDLLTLLFDSPHSPAADDDPVHIDAADPSRLITKAQLRTLTKRTAHMLASRYGIGRQGSGRDVILGISSGNYLLPTVFYGTIAAGGIFSASSPASTPRELAGQIEQMTPKLLICSADLGPVALEAAQIAGFPKECVLAYSGDGAKGDYGFALNEAASGNAVPISQQQLDWERITDRETLENSTICILFSSGTTGKPKGVRLSHQNLVSEAHLTQTVNKEWFAKNNPSFEYRTIAHLPVAHIAGIQGYLVNSLFMGGPIYWMPRFDFPKFLEYNKKYRITFFFTVPPIYLLIAKSPLVTDQFDSLDSAVTGAAPMGKELQAAATKKLGKGKVILCQTWGLSETTGSITLLPKGEFDGTGSVSELVSNHEMKIVDDNGKDVEPGQDGEFWVRGPVVTKGYYQNEEANKSSYVDGWFCTGDIGHFKDGLFYIVDRKKELIKYKATQVAPAELEALLVSHPLIQDAAVIGVQGEGTEVPRAYVVADQKKISAEDIARWVAEHVSNNKKLRGGVVFIDAVPRSPAGKILRKVLRDSAKNERPSKL